MSSGPYYTTEEDQWLRDYYSRSSRQDIMARFPSRTIGGVRQRAWLLGLRKDKDAFDYGPEVITVIGHLSETEKAYLAGIIDGEGCIMLQRRIPKGKRSPTYAACVSIANTSPALREWLDQRFPSQATYGRLHANPSRWRECWSWILSGNRRITVFLREIAPYLVIKRRQAQLLAGGWLLLSEDERLALFHELRALKHTS